MMMAYRDWCSETKTQKSAYNRLLAAFKSRDLLFTHTENAITQHHLKINRNGKKT